MPYIIKSKKVDNTIIKRQWDNIAFERDFQMRSGKDFSFEYILKPTILDAIGFNKRRLIIDAGCGTGVLTENLSEFADRVTGVDISSKSIAIANIHKKDKKICNIDYFESAIEIFDFEEKADIIVSNMVLQDVVSFRLVLNKFNSLLDDDGKVIISITHPCFWPFYWKYFDDSDFFYKKISAIQSDFVIKNQLSIGETIHFHRSLQSYFNGFRASGFFVDDLIEPYVDDGRGIKYPRFIVFVLKKRLS